MWLDCGTYFATTVSFGTHRHLTMRPLRISVILKEKSGCFTLDGGSQVAVASSATAIAEAVLEFQSYLLLVTIGRRGYFRSLRGEVFFRLQAREAVHPRYGVRTVSPHAAGGIFPGNGEVPDEIARVFGLLLRQAPVGHEVVSGGTGFFRNRNRDGFRSRARLPHPALRTRGLPAGSSAHDRFAAAGRKRFRHRSWRLGDGFFPEAWIRTLSCLFTNRIRE